MSQQPETPKYPHDCDRCHFLGRHEYYGTDFDLYVCVKGRFTGCTELVARYGSEGEKCLATGVEQAAQQPDGRACREAYNRAVAAGLIREV